MSGVIDTYMAYKKANEQPKTLIVRERDQVMYLAIDKLQYIEGSGKHRWPMSWAKTRPWSCIKACRSWKKN